METEYRPVKKKYVDWALGYSVTTDRLIKRKHILEFWGGTPDQWLELANDFQADGGKCNQAYCMTKYRLAGGDVSVVEQTERAEEVQEPEFRDDWTDQ